MKIGFAGAGNMAAAIARGLRHHGSPGPMLFTDAGSGRAAALADEVGGESVDSLEALAAGSDCLVLAFKPRTLADAAGELSGFEGPVISILGATTEAQLREALPAAQTLRTMPNLAVEVGRGVICHTPPGPGLDAALDLLAGIATLVELPEEQLDAATAVMGCSPAYLALACEALGDAGAAAGLDPELSRRLVGMTAAGTGEMLADHDPRGLQIAVASPGGSTEAGLEALAERDVPAAFAAAVEASLDRMAGRR